MRAFTTILLALLVCGLQTPSSVHAQTRGALHLDGQGYAEATDDAELDIEEAAITVEAWVKHDGESDADAVIVTKRDAGAIDYELSFVGEGEEVPVRFTVYGETYNVVSTAGVPAGEWTHVAGVFNGTVLTIYVNGELSGTNDLGFDYSRAVDQPLVVGAAPGGSGRFYSGLIDELRIWRAALPNVQLRAGIFGALTGTEANLAAYFSFSGTTDDPAGTTENDLTLVGSARLVAPGIFPVPPRVYGRAGTASANLEWAERLGSGNVNLASQFRIYRSTTANFSDRQLVGTVNAGTTSFVDTGLSNGTTYHYQISSLDATGAESDFSSHVTVTPYGTRGGGALSLRGEGFAELSDRPSLDIEEAAITVEAWVKHDGESDADAVIVTKREGGAIDYELSFVGEGEEVPVRFTVYGETYNVVSAAGVPAGEWTHVAGVFNGTVMTIYVNGELSGSKDVGFDYSRVNDQPLVVGAAPGGSGRFYSGLIDELRIWNVATTGFDLRGRYLNLLAGDEEDLVAYFRFDDLGTNAPRGSGSGAGTFSFVGDASVMSTGVHPVAPRVFTRLTEEGDVRLVWHPRSTGATSHAIYRSTAADGSDRQLVASVGGNVTEFVDTGLANGTTYYYEVTSTSSAGQESDFADMASATVASSRDGNALSLDGNGSYVVVGDRPSLDLETGGMTVEAWVKHDGQSDADAIIVTKRDGGSVDFELSLVGSGEEVPVRFAIYGDSYEVTSDVNVPANEWAHVAGVFGGTVMTIYVNGELSGTRDLGFDYSRVNDQPLVVGAAPGGSGRFYSGLIDELRIWNVATTGFDLRGRYLDLLTGDEEGLVAYFRFDETAGTRAYGSDAAPKTGQLMGSATFTAAQSPVDTEALAELPADYVLEGNYPNPFNPATTIRYGLPAASQVTLGVYDLLGRRVALLLSGAQQAAGWHEVSFDAGALPSGTYLYRLEADGVSRTGRMLLVK